MLLAVHGHSIAAYAAQFDHRPIAMKQKQGMPTPTKS
jgi:hypothetical protein